MRPELAIDRMSFGERLAYAFRERQIYVRSEGQVRFITLRPWVQITFVMLLVGVIGWISYATLNVAFKDYVIAAKNRQFANVQTVYEDRITDMLTSMDQLNGRLLLNQDSVESQLENARELQTALELRQRQIAALVSRQFGVAASDLVPAPVEGPTVQVTDTGSRLMINFEPAQPDIRFSRIPGQQSALGDSDAEMSESVRRLGKRMRDLAKAQRAALDAIETQTQTRRSQLEQAIASLGLDPVKVVPKAKGAGGEGLGGPLVALAAYMPDAPETSEERQVVRIAGVTNDVGAYLDALQRLPILRPLKQTDRITSGFGPRRDPFTGVSAMHQGLDFPHANGTPVYATGPGEVKRAGWAGAYGRMVEINHDNGVSTRYAHLSKVEVKVGQHIEAGQQIGLVGNTGRSTGSHLHYETRLNGNAVNPVKFLKAGSYVLQ